MKVEIDCVAEQTDGGRASPGRDRVIAIGANAGTEKPEETGTASCSALDYRRSEARSQRFGRVGDCGKPDGPPEFGAGKSPPG